MSNRDKQRERQQAAEKWNRKVDEMELDSLARIRQQAIIHPDPHPLPLPEVYAIGADLKGDPHYAQAIANRNTAIQQAIMYGTAADSEESE